MHFGTFSRPCIVFGDVGDIQIKYRSILWSKCQIRTERRRRRLDFEWSTFVLRSGWWSQDGWESRLLLGIQLRSGNSDRTLALVEERLLLHLQFNWRSFWRAPRHRDNWRRWNVKVFGKIINKDMMINLVTSTIGSIYAAQNRIEGVGIFSQKFLSGLLFFFFFQSLLSVF